MKYATRINSFLRTGRTVIEALHEIGQIKGLDYVDMNYPEHFKDNTVSEIAAALQESGLQLNAINLRFRDKYLFGAFDNTDQTIRADAIQLCSEATDVCSKLNGRQCIIWLGFDGFEYSFQKNYVRSWNWLVDAFRTVCQAAPCRVSVEYKPYEERAFAMIDSWGAAWKLIEDVDCDNFGCTLDMCHMLMKKENPAMAAALLLEKGKLTGIHINDGEGSFDDGMMVGTVHPFKTLELFYYLVKYGYQDVIYFDTFPKREDAVRECEMNIQFSHQMEAAVNKIGIEEISKIIDKESGIAAAELMSRVLSETLKA